MEGPSQEGATVLGTAVGFHFPRPASLLQSSYPPACFLHRPLPVESFFAASYLRIEERELEAGAG